MIITAMMIINDEYVYMYKWWWIHVYKVVMLMSCMNVCIWWVICSCIHELAWYLCIDRI